MIQKVQNIRSETCLLWFLKKLTLKLNNSPNQNKICLSLNQNKNTKKTDVASIP